ERHGALLAWVIRPMSRTAITYRSPRLALLETNPAHFSVASTLEIEICVTKTTSRKRKKLGSTCQTGSGSQSQKVEQGKTGNRWGSDQLLLGACAEARR